MSKAKERLSKRRITSLRKKIMTSVIGLLLLAIVSYALVGSYRVYRLSDEVGEKSKSQSEYIESFTQGSLLLDELDKYQTIANLSSENLSKLIDYYELLLSLLHDNAILISSFPSSYNGVYVPEPSYQYDGHLSMQLLMPEGKTKAPEVESVFGKLSSLAPTLYSLIEKTKSTFLSFSISMPDGYSMYYDYNAGKKLDDKGKPLSYDPRDEVWYKDAVSSKNIVFNYEGNPKFFNVPEVIISSPVINGNDVECVLSLHLSALGLKDNLVSSVNCKEEHVLLMDKSGELISSTKTKGELSTESIMTGNVDKIINDKGTADYINRVVKGEKTPSIVKLDGISYFPQISEVKAPGWKEIVIVTEDKLQRSGNEVLEISHTSYNEMISSVHESFKELFINMAIIAILLLITSIFLTFRISKKITHPINIMTKKVKEMTGDNIAFEMLPEYNTKDEIEVLANTFSTMSDKLQEQVQEIVEISAHNERMETELNVATRIQSGLLPKEFPLFPDKTEFDLFASMDPAREVGGDFYDAFLIDDDHLALVVADVSDKGVPSALFMVVSKTLIKTRTLQGGRPAEILTDVNNMLCDENPENLFVTVWLGILTISTGELTEANAGHEKPIIKRKDGEFELLKTKHGLVLGSMKGLKYTEDSFIMNPGDTLFMYTDGVVEAMNSDEELFGFERTLQTLNQNKDLAANELLPTLREQIDIFAADEAQFDDITMLVLKMQ